MDVHCRDVGEAEVTNFAGLIARSEFAPAGSARKADRELLAHFAVGVFNNVSWIAVDTNEAA